MSSNIYEYIKTISDSNVFGRSRPEIKYEKEIHIRIDEYTYNTLKDISKDTGISVSALVRSLIYSFIRGIIGGRYHEQRTE